VIRAWEVPECPECGHAPCLRCDPCIERGNKAVRRAAANTPEKITVLGVECALDRTPSAGLMEREWRGETELHEIVVVQHDASSWLVVDTIGYVEGHGFGVHVEGRGATLESALEDLAKCRRALIARLLADDPAHVASNELASARALTALHQPAVR
jgi:hypothetical protein